MDNVLAFGRVGRFDEAAVLDEKSIPRREYHFILIATGPGYIFAVA
ncbi:hypothetical protein [Nocardia mexicana]|nr:hypothetical protein [Nocardia mexicana]